MSKQPFAYAKKHNGKWYHWRKLAQVGLAVGGAFILPGVFRSLFDYFWDDVFDWIGDIWK